MLRKIYNCKELRNIENEVYYDLYEDIGKNIWVDTVFVVRTQKNVEFCD